MCATSVCAPWACVIGRSPYACLRALRACPLARVPCYASAHSCAMLAPARLFLSLCYFLSLDFENALWQSLNKTGTFRRQKPFAKIMKDTKYLSFLVAEKFLLTTPKGFDTIGLFSGDRASERIFRAPKMNVTSCVCAIRAYVRASSQKDCVLDACAACLAYRR